MYYLDVPVIKILTATGGCGLVSMSWTVIGNNNLCEINNFHAYLVSLSMDVTMRVIIFTPLSSFNLIGLLNDTLFDITIIGSSRLVNSKPVSTSVKTAALKSMYKHIQLCTLCTHMCK